MRATTTATTAVWSGRRCFPVPSLDKAYETAARFEDPLLVGESGGELPPGFHLQNSPTALEQRDDIDRPAILLSSSGTRLLHEAAGAGWVYAASLRNVSAQVAHLTEHHAQVAVLGAGTKGEFRREDQLCCARVAAGLMDHGFAPRDDETLEVVRRWRSEPVEACAGGRSADYLRRTQQVEDLEFVLTRVDDIDAVFQLSSGELQRVR